MRLKSITLAAGIAQAAFVVVNAVSFALTARELSWSSNWRSLLAWPLGIVANALLAVFLITLAIRQK